MIEIKVPPASPPPPKANFSPLWLAYGAGAVIAFVLCGFVALRILRPAPAKPPAVADVPPSVAEDVHGADAPAVESANTSFSANPIPDPPAVSPNPVPDPPPLNPPPLNPTPPPPPPATEKKPPAEKPPAVNPPPASPEVKPAPTKPAPTKAEPVKPTKPFDGFAKELNLPPPSEAKEVKLGPVKIPDDYDCSVHLVGGDGASRTKHAFDCSAEAPTGEPTRAWKIDVQGPGTAKRETIAVLAVRKQQLVFQWTDAAREHPAAGSLGNCALQLSAGQGEHTVALRKPLPAKPLPITYDKQTASWPLPNGPKSDQVQVEFDVVSPRTLPRPRFLGSSTVKPGDEVYIEFGLAAADKFLKLQVQTRLDNDSLDITVTPWMQVTGQPKAVALTESNIKKLQETITQTSLAVDAQLSAMPKTKTPARDALQKQLTAVRQAEAQLAKLKNLEKEFEKSARIKARVFMLADKTLIELITAK